MSTVLQGTPAQVAEKLTARYEPLRDSRAFSEPEIAQRKFLKMTAIVLIAGGLVVEAAVVLSQSFNTLGILFGVVVAALGGVFYNHSMRPLQFSPPEPLENLPALSLDLGLTRSLAESFPEVIMELDPVTSSLTGSADGRDWKVTIEREVLQPISHNKDGSVKDYKVVSTPIGTTDKVSTEQVVRRTSDAVHRHRIVWMVSIEDDFTPRPGQPSPHAALERCETGRGRTDCIFSLPVNDPKENGLGHENRVDFISSPLGLHHPEFVGEQVALSLVWLFNPHPRR